MSLLLDSHTALWWLLDSPRLSRAARAAITTPGRTAFVSALASYELGLKRRLGKLRDMPGDFSAACLTAGFRELAVTSMHARYAADLPLVHRDPWDRMLVAQANVEGLTLVSADEALLAYGVAMIW